MENGYCATWISVTEGLPLPLRSCILKEWKGSNPDTLQTFSNRLSCVRSNPRWMLLSLTARTGNLVTLRCHSTRKITPLLFVFMAIRLQCSEKIFLRSLMAVGRQLQPKVVWMPLSMNSAMVSPMVYFRRIFSGTLLTTMSPEISRMVTSSLDNLDNLMYTEGVLICPLI